MGTFKKGIILPIFYCLSVFSAIAQPKKGDFWLGGDLRFGQSRQNKPRDTASFDIITSRGGGLNPQVGFFLTTKLVAGFEAAINYLNIETVTVSRDGSSVKSNNRRLQMGFGVFATHLRPVKYDIYWRNKVLLQSATITNGISFSSLVSGNKSNVSPDITTSIIYTTGAQYFLNSSVSVFLGIEVLRLDYSSGGTFDGTGKLMKNRGIHVSFMQVQNYLTFGINYLIVSENE